MQFRAVPQIPRQLNPALQAVLEALKENFELMAGQRGAKDFVINQLGYTPVSKDGDTLNGNLLTPQRPIFQGGLGALTGTNFSPGLVPTLSIGFTVNTTAGTLTAEIAGRYFVTAQQLIGTAATAVYFVISKNGAIQAHGYSNNDETFDVRASCIVDLAVGDVVSFFYSGTVTSSWGGAHSSVCAFLLG